jgi:hypothetical protein
VIAAIAITVAADPFVGAWKRFLSDFDTGLRRPVRVFAFGPQGAGKTTLRERLLSPLTPDLLKNPTRQFNSDDAEIKVVVKGNSALKVIIADYAGEFPDQVLLDKHKDFFGPITKGKVDAVFFLVDVIPAYLDKMTGLPTPDARVVELYSSDAEKRIDLRVKEIYRYRSVPQMTTILKLCGAREGAVKSVRLLVSKVDLLQRIHSRGYVKSESKESKTSAEKYVRREYAQLDKELRKICESFRIADYAFLCVNLISGEGILPDWTQILKRIR